MFFIDFIRKTFVYSGRMTRFEYWASLVTLVVAWYAWCTIEGTVLGYPFLGTFLIFVSPLPVLSAIIRRLHDTGHSGIRVWICILIAVFLLLLLPPGRRFPVTFIGLLLYPIVQKSDEGANEYGPDPYAKEKRSKESMIRSKKEIMCAATCPSCGTPQQAKAKFCTSCGTAMRSSDAS